MAEVDFVALPKLELHAHLSGSISRQCLHDIWTGKQKDGDTNIKHLKDPLIEMPQGKFDYDLDTFFPLFSSYIYALVNDEASLVHSTRSVLEDFANDGCVYLELRTTPRAIASVNITKSDYVRLILDTIAISSTQSRMHTKLILSVDRRNTAEEADHVIDLAIKFKEQGVVGVDLCGDPSKGDVTTFRSAFNRAKAAGLNITLHFAEIASQADDRRFGMQEGELMELLKWEPDRIGHVIHVPQQVKDVIKQKKIGLELCLSCNVHAKMMVGGKGGYADHHFGEWIRSDCPIFLCTDDVGVFGSPLSNEYQLAAKHFSLDRRAILTLARAGIESIFSEQDEKDRLRRLLWLD